jgi:hypothetical protein
VVSYIRPYKTILDINPFRKLFLLIFYVGIVGIVKISRFKSLPDASNKFQGKKRSWTLERKTPNCFSDSLPHNPKFEDQGTVEVEKIGHRRQTKK